MATRTFPFLLITQNWQSDFSVRLQIYEKGHNWPLSVMIELGLEFIEL